MLRIGKDLGKEDARPQKAKAVLNPSRQRPTEQSSEESTQGGEKAPKHQRKAGLTITQMASHRVISARREARASGTVMRTVRKGPIHIQII